MCVHLSVCVFVSGPDHLYFGCYSYLSGLNMIIRLMYVNVMRCKNCSYSNVAKGSRLLDNKAFFVNTGKI